MDLIADRGRRVTVEELNTTRLLAHAKKQAQQRKFDDMLIVDVDAHHYENECMDDILPYVENDVIRQLAVAGRAKGRGSLVPSSAIGFQDMGGRITRYPLRSSEKTEKGEDARRAARPSLDGRDERRLFLPVPDADARRSACIPTPRWRSSCAGPITAGSPKRRCRNRTDASIRC